MSVSVQAAGSRQVDFLAAAALVISAVILYGATNYHPYSYYQLLRWIVCASAILGAWSYASYRWYIVSAGLAVIAFLFNPLRPIYMHKYEWRPYDLWSALITAALAVVLVLVSLRQAKANPSEVPNGSQKA